MNDHPADIDYRSVFAFDASASGDRQPAAIRRRTLLRAALGAGLLAGAPAGLGASLATDASGAAKAAPATAADRILVVLELSGGNDGLNMLVPYQDDAYYRLRPNIGLHEKVLLKIDDRHGFSPGMNGFERLYKDGSMAIIHGCGYCQPFFSHYGAMSCWQTGVPANGKGNGNGDPFGWMGKLADAIDPVLTPDFLVNIDAVQSLAVRSRRHVPIVMESTAGAGASRRLMNDLARAVKSGATDVTQIRNDYRTPVDYGGAPLDLPGIAALMAADFPARLYYTSYRNNAFDTHVRQEADHPRLLRHVADAIAGFMQDLERIGRADHVAVMVFSEFGRRPAENSYLGTDHGTASHMYLIGKQVRGGQYGMPPSLTALDETGNMAYTTDFRRVYASVAEGWLGLPDSRLLLGDRYGTIPIFEGMSGSAKRFARL